MRENIYVTRPSMPSYEEYTEMIKPIWDSHWMTNMGAFHAGLEEKLRDYLGVEALSLMVNGHMALELTIQAMDLPAGGEVITTPFTFISTTHAIVRNHLKPVFCDIKMSDGTIDEEKIEELITENTVAIVPVHVYGNVCNIERIEAIAHKYGLKVIYDAAHAFGISYKGRGIGNYGDASVFSFHATKVFNTIEGGCAAFSDAKLYEKLYNLKNFGIRGEELVTSIGANAKMNEFQAAMGLCNLRHVSDEIEKRRRVAKRYMVLLEDVEGITCLCKAHREYTANYAYFPIVIDEAVFGANRDFVYNRLKENKIFSRKYFYPLTADSACFKNKYRQVKLDNSRWLANHVLVLPLYADLDCESVDYIVSLLKGIKDEL